MNTTCPNLENHILGSRNVLCKQLIITSGYTAARIITSEPNSLTEQDTVKVSEGLVGKQLYSAFQLLCITICITTKETNFKVQALHESSMSGCQHSRGQGAKIWKFICVAVNELRKRSYCFRYKSLLSVKPGLKQKLKKKTTLRQLAQIIISIRRGRYAFDYLYISAVHMKTMI